LYLASSFTILSSTDVQEGRYLVLGKTNFKKKKTI